jgi:hypothetical protein
LQTNRSGLSDWAQPKDFITARVILIATTSAFGLALPYAKVMLMVFV